MVGVVVAVGVAVGVVVAVAVGVGVVVGVVVAVAVGVVVGVVVGVAVAVVVAVGVVMSDDRPTRDDPEALSGYTNGEVDFIERELRKAKAEVIRLRSERDTWHRVASAESARVEALQVAASPAGVPADTTEPTCEHGCPVPHSIIAAPYVCPGPVAVTTEPQRRKIAEQCRQAVIALYSEDSYPPPRGTHGDDDPLNAYDAAIADAEIAISAIRDGLPVQLPDRRGPVAATTERPLRVGEYGIPGLPEYRPGVTTDEPERCEHGNTGPHIYRPGLHCPGRPFGDQEGTE